MGRSTFDGPVLAGDNRFGPLRDVGYAELVQNAFVDLTNVTANTANYGGVSGQYVGSNGIPNSNAVTYTPSATAYPPTAATITADAGTAIYRGVTLYLPVGSKISEINCIVGAVPTLTSGTITGINVYVSNGFNTGTTPAYGSFASISAVGSQTLTLTAAQITNWQGTSADIANQANPSQLSQVVFNIACTAASGLAAPFTAGKFYFQVHYVQLDGNIGSTTAYPYGNFD